MIKKPSFKEEQLLWERGITNIAGLDEVGRGAFAGPLVAASVILPKDFKAYGIRDSKLLTQKQREEFSEYIKNESMYYSISEVNIHFINKFGIGKSTQRAFNLCLRNLKEKFEFVLVDGFKIKILKDEHQKAIIHGDNISVSIAAASIVAKAYRDNVMRNLHKDYPMYNFFQNKGYGTKFHRDALKKYGLSKIHRTSFNLGKYI